MAIRPTKALVELIRMMDRNEVNGKLLVSHALCGEYVAVRKLEDGFPTESLECRRCQAVCHPDNLLYEFAFSPK